MRLAIVFERVDPTRGGAETYVADLARGLVERGHAVDLYAHRWRDGALPPEVRCLAVPVTGRLRWERVRSFARNSAARLENHSYDCTIGLINTWHQDVLIPQGGVHPASLEANSRRFPAGWRRGLYRLGKTLNPKYWSYRAIERRQYDPARGAEVVAVSRMVRGHLERFYQVPGDRIHVIPNAIDPQRLTVADPAAVRARFRSRFGLGADDLVGLFVGHNFELKGLRPLLAALRSRIERGGDVRPIHLAVCGGGRLGRFRRFVRALGLERSVRLIGYYPEIRDGYHASDFFVLPSYYDPCSLVVLEALACGLPVITTACNGAGELMTPGSEGFVISAPDARDELVAALDRMTDDGARAAMAVRARRLGQAQGWDRHLTALLAVFERVARARSGEGNDSRGGRPPLARIPGPRGLASHT